MKQKYWALALVLTACLICAGVWSFSLEDAAPTQPGVTPIAPGALVFTELCSKNETIIADNAGRYRDYAELYNGGETVCLDGFYLTDGKGKSIPFQGITLQTGEYLLVFLGDDLTGFALGASGGDCLQLITPEGAVAAQASTVPAGEDQVMLLQNREYVLSKDASPGFSNDEQGLLAFRQGWEQENPKLVISEVLVQNVSSLPDEQGRFVDVIELHNQSEEPVLLSDYYLSDSLQNRFQYRLPAQELPADGYLVIFCDGENRVAQQGQIHGNFGLSAGDTLCLTYKDGSYTAAAVTFPGNDISSLRSSSGEYAPGAVSLGYSNDEEGAARFYYAQMSENAPLVIHEVLLSSAKVPYAGAFRDGVEIINRSQQTVNTAGWFLSDGGDPYAWPLPQKDLAPGECWVILCSREQTGFSLSASDTLRLTTPEFKIASLVSCSLSQPGQSISYTDGAYVSTAVTLGYSNNVAGEQAYIENALPQGLRISEMMSANRSYLKGGYATTSDWIELYNGSQETVQLSDYYLTDDGGELQKYRLPAKELKPGEYWVALLAENTTNLRRDLPILPFTLSSQGETLYLSRSAQVMDYVVLPELESDQAYGRASGAAGFSILSSVTPGSANGAPAEVSQAPTASVAQGVYNTQSLMVELFSTGKIYYTTDCERPNRSSKVYTGPLYLTETTVIRAIAYEDGKKPSQVIDLTYVINEGHALPVASLVTDPDNLWDFETGIYVKGPNASTEFPYRGANFWKPWEKQATVSLYEMEGGGFSSVPCGIRIFGAFSRGLPIKAFSCFFRDSYGAADLAYPLFGEAGLDTYESFIFRASGQDYYRARMRDVLITSLVAEQTTVAVQKYRPVILYLNGEFWGVYFIREKLNENYVAGNYNVEAKDVTITSYNGKDSKEYTQLIQYVKTHDLSKQEYYDYVCSQVDIENYMDFYISQIWIGNADIDNIRFFKTPGEKWKWILYDTDFGMWNVDYNSVEQHLNPKGTGGYDAVSTALINGLLKNPEFKEAFLTRMAWQMNHIWTEENVCQRIDELESLVGTDMQRDCVRWKKSYSDWKKCVNDLRKFVPKRNSNLLTYIQDYFDLTDNQMRQYGFMQ